MQSGLKRQLGDLILKGGYDVGPRIASRVRQQWVKLRNPRADIRFGPGCRLGKGFALKAPWGGTFEAGSGCDFRRDFRAELFGPSSSIRIGEQCVFNYYSVVQCAGEVSIGDQVTFAFGSMVVDGSHRFRDSDRPMRDQGFDLKRIRIDDHVGVMAKATVIANIGERAFVGANSAVVDDIPAFTVAVGAPARVVDYFGPPGREPEGWEAKAADGR
jgi:acetyltransferase-like isoleucine patch superfamily enzyme